MYSQSSMVVGNATSTMPSGNQLTMSSREIANLTGKLHAHVIRDINSMLNDLLKDDPNLDDEIKLNVTFEYDSREYVSNVWLGRKYIECLLTGYSSSLRMKVIKRLHELEDSVFQLPKTLPEALRAYADECEKNLKLESKIQKVGMRKIYSMGKNSTMCMLW